MLSALFLVLRFSVESARFAIADYGVAVSLMLVAVKWGGGFAVGVTALVLLSADYFFVDPLFELGVTTWQEAMQLWQFGLAAAVMGIVAVRVYLLAHPRRQSVKGKALH